MASAATTLINVDLGNSGAVATGGAVLGGTGDVWNNPGVTGTSPNQSVPSTLLKWADNTNSGVSFSISSGIYGLGSGGSTDPMMQDYAFLYDGSLGGAASASSVTITLSGLTGITNLSSLVFYANGGGVKQNGTFTVNGQTETTTALSATPGAQTPSTLEGDTYVRFDNVAVTGGQLQITWSNDVGGAGGAYSILNGMQIAVPEPSAALLGGLGMLALLRRRRN